MEQKNRNEWKIQTGFKTIILGICLYILELLTLPVFALIQKSLVDGNGFFTNCWKYVGEKPYPMVFLLTGIIIMIGVVLVFLGYKEKDKRN